MTITISNNEKFYSFESNPDLLEQALEDTLTKSKLFPLSFDQLFKQISKKINTQKKKRVELAIHKLKQNGIIIMIETNYGPAYFCKKNEILVFNKFIAILQHFHKQFPHKSGITKSQIREFFSSNKKKKKQKSICPFLLNYIIQIAHKQQLINIAGNSLSIKGFVPRFESIEITLEILMELIMKNFDFKKSDKKEFAKEMNISISEMNQLLKILKQKGLVFEIKENMLIDVYNLQKLKKIVQNKIIKDGPTHIREFAQILNKSRNSVYFFFDFLDKINFTKRIDDKRILVNDKIDC